jgi:hypothetical protein
LWSRVSELYKYVKYGPTQVTVIARNKGRRKEHAKTLNGATGISMSGGPVWVENWQRRERKTVMAYFNHLKTKRICSVYGFSAYRAVNTLHFGYTNQSLNVL